MQGCVIEMLFLRYALPAVCGICRSHLRRWFATFYHVTLFIYASFSGCIRGQSESVFVAVGHYIPHYPHLSTQEALSVGIVFS